MPPRSAPSPSRPPPPPLGLALGLLAAAAAIFLAVDCEASAIGLQLLPRCSEARFVSARSHGEAAGVMILVALAYGASALLLVFASATFAHRWRRTPSSVTKAGLLKPVATGQAPVASTALPAPTVPTGALPRATRPPGGGATVASPHAARGRAITDARALKAYLSAEEALKRKGSAASEIDSNGTVVGSSFLASPAVPGTTIAQNAGISSGLGAYGGRHEMGASMSPLWTAAVGSPSGTPANYGFAATPHAACSRHPLPSGGLASGILSSPTGAASYGRSPPVGAISPLAPGERRPGAYAQPGTDMSRVACGMGPFPLAAFGASPQGSVAHPRGSPHYYAMGPGAAGSSPMAESPCFGSNSPMGAASPFANSPFAASPPCGAVGLSPFAAAHGPPAALGGNGVDHSRRISSGSAGGGSSSKYQRAMYIPSSGDKQQDPSVIARRATRLLRALKLLDESSERGSTLSK